MTVAKNRSAFWGVVLVLALVMNSDVFAQEPYQRFVRKFETNENGILHPAGLAYSPLAGGLLVSPSPGARELFLITFAPDIVDTANIATAIPDPVNMAFDNQSNALYFLDTSTVELIEIMAGDDGLPDSSQAAVGRFDATSFGIDQAKGMTFDSKTGDLLFLVVPDSLSPAKIVRVAPDSAKGFDGPTAQQAGNIQVIELGSLPISHYRGIAYNPVDEHLYIMRPDPNRLFEITQEGELISERDFSEFELSDIQNMAFAPSGDATDDPGIMNLYIADTGYRLLVGVGDVAEVSLTKPVIPEIRVLTIDDVMVLEGDQGITNAVFTVSLSGPSHLRVTMDYITQNTTASSINDYVFGSGSLAFEVGETSKSVAVQINGDVVPERNETFLVKLINTRGLIKLGDTQGVCTILDDDSRYRHVPAQFPTIGEAFNAASDGDTILVAPGFYQEAVDMSQKSVVLASWFMTTLDASYISKTVLDGNGASAVVTVRKSAGNSTQITGLTIQNGSDGISPRTTVDILYCRISGCRDGIDYKSGSGGLCKFNILENNDDDGIDLDNAVDLIIDDNIIRNNGDDGIAIRLQPYLGNTAQYIIRNNDIYGNKEDGIQLIHYDIRTNRFFLIERNLIRDNLMAGLGITESLQTRENFEGAGIPERIFLFNNVFSGNAYGVSGGDSLIALNNIFVDQKELAMKNVNGGSIVAFGVFWNNLFDFEDCVVDSSTILFSNPYFDDQFRLAQDSPAIDRGTATFDWNGETVFDLLPGDYSGANPDLGRSEFTGTPIPSLSINDVTVTEHDSETVYAILTTMLSFVSDDTIQVTYATSDGTAMAPEDYETTLPSILAFLPGQTRQNIVIGVKADLVEELDETIIINLSESSNATIRDNQGIVTIVDNDSELPVTMSFQDGINGYNGTRDTRLLSEAPNTNSGTSVRLDVDGSPDQAAIIYWDVSEIPSGSAVQSVAITFNITNLSGSSYEVYELLRPWVEYQATWNAYADGQNWQVAGASGAEDSDSIELGALIALSKGLHTFLLNDHGISVVQSWVNNPEQNHGIIIKDYEDASNGVDFSSRENGTASLRPKLAVTYLGKGHPGNPVKQGDGSQAEDIVSTPFEFDLRQNYPNPFNPSTRISYAVPQPSEVTLKVFDTLGREVQTLVSELKEPGIYSVDFDASHLSAGLYFYVLRTNRGFVATKKLLYLK